jgi:hypothetical protein
MGGGLCNLANTIHLLFLHSPLEVTEFHQHSDALAPDEGKRVPFSSGTSVVYNYIDYRVKNTTDQDVQLCLWCEDEKLFGEYYSDYRLGNMTLEPISKGHYYGWPGAIYCAVWDENNAPLILCKCAGLTDEFKEELKNNYDSYHMMPITITGMMLSEDNSIRHPKLISIRDNDIDVKDCTLAKIKG